MKYILFLLVLLINDGCIFEPPTKVDNKIVVHQETEESPNHIDKSTEDLLIDKKREKILSLALAEIGTPYVYGGTDLDGFDCSGFVNFVYKYSVEKNLPRTARGMSDYLSHVSRHQLRPGDVVFFDTSLKGYINHCGIYMGNGKFVHASSGRVHSVTISNLDKGFYKNRFRWGGRVLN